MSDPIYDTIGTGYNSTRQADPYIASRILKLLQPQPELCYLDIGCGTGNYFNYFTKNGYLFHGLDPSETMLSVARANNPGAILINGKAEFIPYPDSYFAGATAMFTFHHWKQQQAGLLELFRVLMPGAALVFLTFDGYQMEKYWLAHYFPEMIKRSGALVPSEAEMKTNLENAGFSNVISEKYFVTNDLKDQFLYAHKYRPQMYLDASVRSGISSFSAFSTPGELNSGLKRLKSDIETHAIHDIISQYENDRGDYLFIKANK